MNKRGIILCCNWIVLFLFCISECFQYHNHNFGRTHTKSSGMHNPGVLSSNGNVIKSRLGKKSGNYHRATLMDTHSVSANAASMAAAVDLRWTEFSDSGTQSAEPPVIILHGLLGNKKNFATVGNMLSNNLDKKRQIFGLDLRNHGDNHHDWREDMGYAQMAMDVKAFMDSNSISKAVIVGHSMGGKVAQTLALLEPDRAEGLIVIDIAPVKYENNEHQWKSVTDIIRFLNSIEIYPGIARKDVDDELKKAIPDPALRAFCLTNLDTRKGTWKIHIRAIVAELDRLAGFDLNYEEYQYHGDTFFIHGGQSKFVRHAHIDTIANFFPNHMLTTIRHAGHWVHAEAPDDTVLLLKRYLDR